MHFYFFHFIFILRSCYFTTSFNCLHNSLSHSKRKFMIIKQTQLLFKLPVRSEQVN